MVTQTVGFRSTQAVIQNVEIADHRQDERMVNSNAVGNSPLQHWQNRTAHDCHIEKP
jgi:hypothetical protein